MEKKPFFDKIHMEIPSEVKYAVTRLKKAGFNAYPVGGCVRDILLGRVPNDWDITTSAKPEETIEVFKADTVIETGLKHGTVTLLKDDTMTEITTFRVDGEYIDFRHPDQVIFTESIEEDLARRDFTVNAMAMDIEEGRIIDPYGGKKDLQQGIIRCVGDAELRFKEDSLRILRALRFASVYGMDIEEKTALALIRHRNSLVNISVERIRSEMDRLLAGINAAVILQEYQPVFQVIIPEIEPMVGFDQKNVHHIYDVWQHTLKVIDNSPENRIIRWAALFHDMGKPDCFFLGEDGQGHFYGHGERSAEIASAIMNRLKFDNATKRTIKELVYHHDEVLSPSRKSVKRRLSNMGEENLRRMIALAEADNMGQNPRYRDRLQNLSQVRDTLNQIIADSECFTLKDLKVDGRDMISLGYKGREIGQILSELLEQVIEENTENERDRLLEKARQRKKKL